MRRPFGTAFGAVSYPSQVDRLQRVVTPQRVIRGLRRGPLKPDVVGGEVVPEEDLERELVLRRRGEGIRSVFDRLSPEENVGDVGLTDNLLAALGRLERRGLRVLYRRSHHTGGEHADNTEHSVRAALNRMQREAGFDLTGLHILRHSPLLPQGLQGQGARRSDPDRHHPAPLPDRARLEEAGEDADARLTRRREFSAPLLDELDAWLAKHDGRHEPKSPLGRAITYLKGQRGALGVFLLDGQLKLDNGAVERALRGIAVGRHNWLFAGSDAGAERAAILYTSTPSSRRRSCMAASPMPISATCSPSSAPGGRIVGSMN